MSIQVIRLEDNSPRKNSGHLQSYYTPVFQFAMVRNSEKRASASLLHLLCKLTMQLTSRNAAGQQCASTGGSHCQGQTYQHFRSLVELATRRVCNPTQALHTSLHPQSLDNCRWWSTDGRGCLQKHSYLDTSGELQNLQGRHNHHNRSPRRNISKRADISNRPEYRRGYF